jgi:peroxiredoxin
VPNDLTGDFDVAAQFAVPAVNRILAAMHAVERFPHSASIRVDDVPWRGPKWQPSVVAAVDEFGDVVADQDRIGMPNPFPGLLASASAVMRTLDPIVNIGDAGLQIEPVQPSDLQGRAQIQLFPPTIEVTDGSGSKVTVRMTMLARYFPDPNTSPAAEFIRGELRITAPVGQVASQVANVVEIDIKSAALDVSFTPLWSSRPLSAEDRAAINLLIRNAIRTSFLPSNSTLPSNIRHMRFRTVQAGGNAVAVLLNLAGGPGNPATAGNSFLKAGDHFALAVGADYVRSAFQPVLDEMIAQPVEPISFRLSIGIKSWNITYAVVLNSASVELVNDAIILSIRGRASTGSWTPNFNFTVKQRFSLAVSGSTAELVVGDISIDTSSWIIDRFRGLFENSMRRVRDRAIQRSGALAMVRKMLSADSTLGPFLNSLLKPATPKAGPQLARVVLDYTDAGISPQGIVLHGSLRVNAWPAPHAEFEKITANAPTGPGGVVTGIAGGPDYSALKSWIPGGSIQRYEWKLRGDIQTGFMDENRFVYMTPPPGATATMSTRRLITGFVPMCVTIHGTRLSHRGAINMQPVTATVCGVSSFPLFDAAFNGDLPVIALAEPDSSGMVRITGHTLAGRAESGRPAANLVVHFPEGGDSSGLEKLVTAMREGRDSISAAVIAVVGSDDVQRARFVDGVTYSPDDEGTWEKKLGIRIDKRPFTVVTGKGGRVILQQPGEPDIGAIEAALKKSAPSGTPAVPVTLRPLSARIGQLPPDFIFEHAPGHEVTLRKIAGRPVTLAFWRSMSKQSIERLRSIPTGNGSSEEGVLLCINDGEEPEAARRAAEAAGLRGILVTDPQRRISQAYGVDTWPTVISVDAAGVVRSVEQGTSASASRPVEQTSKGSAS